MKTSIIDLILQLDKELEELANGPPDKIVEVGNALKRIHSIMSIFTEEEEESKKLDTAESFSMIGEA